MGVVQTAQWRSTHTDHEAYGTHVRSSDLIETKNIMFASKAPVQHGANISSSAGDSYSHRANETFDSETGKKDITLISLISDSAD